MLEPGTELGKINSKSSNHRSHLAYVAEWKDPRKALKAPNVSELKTNNMDVLTKPTLIVYIDRSPEFFNLTPTPKKFAEGLRNSPEEPKKGKKKDPILGRIKKL